MIHVARPRLLPCLAACCVLAACGPSKLSDLKGLRLSVMRGETLGEPNGTVMSLPYDQTHSGCLTGGNVTATLNGRTIPVTQGDVGHLFLEWGHCYVTGAELVPTAEDVAAPETVIEATDGSVSIRARIDALFVPLAFTITEPQNGVLVPGVDAVLTWTPASDAVPSPIDCAMGCAPVVKFVYDAFTTTWAVPADAVTLSGNTVRFRVPADAMAASGSLYLDLDTVEPHVSECTGVTSCTVQLVYDAAFASLATTIGP